MEYRHFSAPRLPVQRFRESDVMLGEIGVAGYRFRRFRTASTSSLECISCGDRWF